MIYKDNLIDVVGGIVASMNFTTDVISVVDNGDGSQTLTLCDIFHSQPGFEITIGPDVYTIMSIDPFNSSITIWPSAPLVTASQVTIYPAKYYHGTPIETSTELDQEKDANAKTPMVYFMENFTERFFEDVDDVRERVSNIRLFFLTQADFSNWQTEDFYTNAIEPMRKLMENWIATLKLDKRFDTNEQEFTAINHARFGVHINGKGTLQSLFVDNLSGVEIQIPLLKLKNLGICPPC